MEMDQHCQSLDGLSHRRGNQLQLDVPVKQIEHFNYIVGHHGFPHGYVPFRPMDAMSAASSFDGSSELPSSASSDGTWSQASFSSNASFDMSYADETPIDMPSTSPIMVSGSMIPMTDASSFHPYQPALYGGAVQPHYQPIYQENCHWVMNAQSYIPAVDSFADMRRNSMPNPLFHQQQQPAPVPVDLHDHRRGSMPTSGYHHVVADGPAPEPVIKMEYCSSPPTESVSFCSEISSGDEFVETAPTQAKATEIDTLMQIVQSCTGEHSKQVERSDTKFRTNKRSRTRKEYICKREGCGKVFHQKTHLEIHHRTHTGAKPFVCEWQHCRQGFTQLGNLKTHMRRHTGERPYSCDICGKSFAQRGNVKAHKVVHSNEKPFKCELDKCDQHFSQLGNLKSHQNKFHQKTIQELRQLFKQALEGDISLSQEQEKTMNYFSGLYKNCNKGIKGRGKDRRISNTSALSNNMGHLGMHGRF